MQLLSGASGNWGCVWAPRGSGLWAVRSWFLDLVLPGSTWFPPGPWEGAPWAPGAGLASALGLLPGDVPLGVTSALPARQHGLLGTRTNSFCFMGFLFVCLFLLF